MEARARRLAPITLDRSRTLRRNPTDAERKLWSALRRKSLAGARFRRQYPLGEYFADFCCLEHKLIIEVDGGQHAQAQEYDSRRTKFLETLGFRVLRFWNSDVLINLEGVLAAVLPYLPPS
jgi:very-short-patch-repair endonuclease